VELHHSVADRLGRAEQRYTVGRRTIVDVLAAAGRPLTVPEVLAAADRRALPQSSAYRNLTVLVDAGVVHRLAGTDDHARYELAEELAGHHHHVLCGDCGRVADVETSPGLERALADAARLVSEQTGFEVTGHRIDLVGRCGACR
jgi:Fe2+ or Zn2+ uptake regulation protein